MEKVAARTLAPVVFATAVWLVDRAHCVGRHDDRGLGHGIGANFLARVHDGGLGYGNGAVDWITGCHSGLGAKSLTRRCCARQTNPQAGVLSALPSMIAAYGMWDKVPLASA